MGQVLTSVLWSIIYADSQKGALVRNLVIFQIERKNALISNLTNFQIEGKNALPITALSHCAASKGLRPTLVSSAEHRPRKLPYEPTASCILLLFSISALIETCYGGILCS